MIMIIIIILVVVIIVSVIVITYYCLGENISNGIYWGIGLVEFHQHVVLAYAEYFSSFLDIFDHLNPKQSDVSAYMLSVLRFG